MVATETVMVAALVPFKLTEPGFTVQVASEGAPVQVKLTAPVSPPWGEMLRSYVAVPPALTVAEVEDPAAAATEKSSPVPDSATLCGLPAALSVMLKAADRAPPAVGLNVTLIVQLAPALRELPQLSVCAKSFVSLPVIAMPLMVSAALPVFFKLTVCTLLDVATI